jgi:transposase-like protein
MPKVSKFTKEQKLDIVVDLITAKLSHAEVCRKYEISSTYAYKLRDRALELLRQGIDHEVPRPSSREQGLIRRVAALEQLAGDQALAIRALKKTKGWS